MSPAVNSRSAIALVKYIIGGGLDSLNESLMNQTRRKNDRMGAGSRYNFIILKCGNALSTARRRTKRKEATLNNLENPRIKVFTYSEA
jgi:hypothetical protein